MVDFRKRLEQKETSKLLAPDQIYERLDRAVDKGPLRPAQVDILQQWNENRRSERDVIIKLHTGQGKTLIGLLILQSKLNEGIFPALYLCPNNFLVNQTATQAKQFGIKYCLAEDDLPVEFLEGKSILITSVQKLFNGFTKFGLDQQSKKCGAIVLDDAHSCIEAIQSSCTIEIPKAEPAYGTIRDLFTDDLQHQGMGTFADIVEGNADAVLNIPYWSWQRCHTEITTCLAKNKDRKSIKFAWPILKDRLLQCQCFVSGEKLEIVPYLAPLQVFGTFHSASHRVFMSATVSDDSFLVKGLGLDHTTILNPITYAREKWSGEKMILIPGLFDSSLDYSKMLAVFARPRKKASFGRCVLTPSFEKTRPWQKLGSIVATTETIDRIVDNLKQGERLETVVFANRYDGIDLPDDACRLLILDSLPYAQNLADKYFEKTRNGSSNIVARTARAIEQGLGRSVRGEKDYCAIVLVGSDLVRFVRTSFHREFLSNQTKTQIEIGLEIAELAQDDISKGENPEATFIKLINQCIQRDEGWKDYYVEQMDKHAIDKPQSRTLEIYAHELKAETLFQKGRFEEAGKCIQELLDKYVKDDHETGWYLQEMARYRLPLSATDSNDLQVHAHRKNLSLLKPRTGMIFKPMHMIGQKRAENIIKWIKSFPNYSEISITLEDILSDLSFGVKSEKFESALKTLGKALGFESERPDNEWKEGPDNLWALRDNEFLLFECKNEVESTRSEINKHESEQMNRSCAWFEKHYVGAKCHNIIIIPTNQVSSAGSFLREVHAMRISELKKLKKSIREFFAEFSDRDLNDLSEVWIQERLQTHSLAVEDIQSKYEKALYEKK